MAKRRSDDAKAITRLVRTMVRELDRFDGSKRSRPHYQRFRTAKHKLVARRPDLAPGILRFAVGLTHWGQFDITEDDPADEWSPDEWFDLDYWEDLEGYDEVADDYHPFEKTSP